MRETSAPRLPAIVQAVLRHRTRGPEPQVRRMPLPTQRMRTEAARKQEPNRRTYSRTR